MREATVNPFNITKAVDFSDQEIKDYWVDMPTADGFAALAKPRSAMPMMILGGKGSGKTHLMRYFSYPIQKLRHHEDVVSGICRDGYIGIYFRCSGLNAARFSGKGQTDEAWASVFAYYMDLWLAQLVLATIQDAYAGRNAIGQADPKICKGIIALFDDLEHPLPGSVLKAAVLLARLQKEVDIAVNNCAISSKLDVRIRATRGKMVFGIPRVLGNLLPDFRNVQFLYLIDEFENISASQQRYVNTLLRERESPCSFKIGSRLYGVRTYHTYSADEENKEGSEFERLLLDSYFIRAKKQYRAFARRLCARRLHEAGYLLSDANNRAALGKSLAWFFEVYLKSPFAQAETRFAVEKYPPQERPYLKALRRKLEEGSKAGTAVGVCSETAVTRIVESLRVEEYPVLEKANIFLLYQDWNASRSLPEAAQRIAEECREYMRSQSQKSRHREVLAHFGGDLVAQILRECDQKQRYLGIEVLIDMSGGLPKNLLVALKDIFQWAAFNGEEPFRDKPICIASQQKGVKEASEWFFRDARAPGADGTMIRDGINRLATLFREIRFSDKPTECSISTFSADTSRISSESLRLIELAENWSLLINISGGQRERNTKRVSPKYQLNPMLAPRWDLPVYRRGAIALTPEEINAIFDPTCTQNFKSLLQQRVDKMTAPYFGKKRAKAKNGKNKGLPGTEDPKLPGL
jgi:hypothetical protein